MADDGAEDRMGWAVNVHSFMTADDQHLCRRADCPQADPVALENSEKEDAAAYCFNCGQSGHTLWKCPQPKENGKPAAAGLHCLDFFLINARAIVRRRLQVRQMLRMQGDGPLIRHL